MDASPPKRHTQRQTKRVKFASKAHNESSLLQEKKRSEKKPERLSLIIALHSAIPTISVHIMTSVAFIAIAVAVTIAVPVHRKPQLRPASTVGRQRCTYARDSGCGAPICWCGAGIIEVLELWKLGSLLLQLLDARGLQIY